MTCSHEFNQIVVAGHISREQNKMVAYTCERGIWAFVCVVVADIDLTAENGLYAHILTTLKKVGSAEHISMVRYGTGWHTKIFGAGTNIFDTYGSIKQAVFSMAMQMHKIGHGILPSTWRVTVFIMLASR